MKQLLRFGAQCQRSWQLAIALLLVVSLWAAPAWATGVSDFPDLEPGTSYVVDQGNVLSFLSRSSLDRQLGELAKTTGKEVHLVTFNRLDYGETTQSLAEKLFQRWFPTPDAQANQVLLVLDTKTNTTAIQTGAEVKEVLSDDIAESVASETTLVPIRDGNYNQGLLDASERLATVLAGKPDPGPPEIRVVEPTSTFKSAEDTNDRSATIIVVVLLLLATIIPMVTYFMYQGQG